MTVNKYKKREEIMKDIKKRKRRERKEELKNKLSDIRSQIVDSSKSVFKTDEDKELEYKAIFYDSLFEGIDDEYKSALSSDIIADAVNEYCDSCLESVDDEELWCDVEIGDCDMEHMFDDFEISFKKPIVIASSAALASILLTIGLVYGFKKRG